jgi:hypothetical protein
MNTYNLAIECRNFPISQESIQLNINKYRASNYLLRITKPGHEPMNAVLDLEATYKTTANPSVLLENPSFNRKVDTNVSILLNGNLSNPQPDFNINFPTVSSVLKSEIEYKLQDRDTRQTQAFALLSTGSFVTAETAGNAAYGPLFERAGSLINGLFADEDSKLQLGFDYSQGNRLTEISDRVGVTVSTRINDRISINGKVGVPVGGVASAFF